MARALVTGASGFIGSKLTEQLIANGDEVTCFVRSNSRVDDLRSLGARLALGDVRDADSVRAAVANCDVVYHLAGLTTAFRLHDLMEVNAGGFRNMVAACARRETPPTVVLVSSLAAHGPSPAGRPRIESDPAVPVSNYGRAKRAAELIAEEFASQVPLTIVGPPIVFGQGDLKMRNLFRSIFRFGIHLALGIAQSRYSLVHVRDLASALILCAQRGTRLVGDASAVAARTLGRGYYFVAGEEQPTFAELGPLIGNALGCPHVRVWRTPHTALLWSAAAVAEVTARLRGQPYIFNFDKAREAQAGSWTCSPNSIRNELGFAPRASLVDRLAETADWYLQHSLL